MKKILDMRQLLKKAISKKIVKLLTQYINQVIDAFFNIVPLNFNFFHFIIFEIKNKI